MSQKRNHKLNAFTNLIALFATAFVTTVAAGPILGTSSAAKACIIREIVSLRSGEIIPAQILLGYSSRSIAESLVFRIRSSEKQELPISGPHPSVNPGLYDLLKNSEVLMFIHPEHLSSILHRGFLNQHQLGRSSGILALSQRCSTEDNLAQVKLSAECEEQNLDSPVHYIRPKYGILNLLKQSDLYALPFSLVGRKDEVSSYGEVLVVFREEVKKRATFTVDDSLLQPNRIAKSLWSSLIEGPYVGRYLEVQIWGELNINDVKEFRIPQGNKELADAVKTSGLPIYEYDLQTLKNKAGTHDWMYLHEFSLGRGKQISPGTQEQPDTALNRGDDDLFCNKSELR